MPEIFRSVLGDSYDVIKMDELGTSYGVPTQPPESRSSHWPTVEKAAILRHPACECCGTRKDLQVHHVTPFHLDPSKELDPDNLIVLCRRDHFFVGHLGDWKAYNPRVREDCREWNTKIVSRPYT